MRDLFTEGVSKNWSKLFVGNVFDFFPGINVDVNIKFVDVTDEILPESYSAVTVNLFSDTCGRSNSVINI